MMPVTTTVVGPLIDFFENYSKMFKNDFNDADYINPVKTQQNFMAMQNFDLDTAQQNFVPVWNLDLHKKPSNFMHSQNFGLDTIL